MLVLKTRVGQAIRLIDQNTNTELGIITRIQPKQPHEVLLGFEFLPEIQILRESLLTGKESTHAKQTLHNGGWIKLHRQSFDSQVWQNPHLWLLWCYCLLKANHTDKDWIPIDGVTLPVLVKRGQFVTGRKKLHAEVYPRPDEDTPSSLTLWRYLRKLEKAQNLNIKPTNKYTIVTVCNYETYQSSTPKKTQQKDASCTTTEQQLNTNKNDKEIYSPNSKPFVLSSLLFNEIKNRKPDFKKPNLQQWSVHIDRMIRIDKRDPDRIAEVIEWSQGDDFWRNNILSTKKLRKQFDQLELKMRAEKGNTPAEDSIEPVERDAEGRTQHEQMLAKLGL